MAHPFLTLFAPPFLLFLSQGLDEGTKDEKSAGAKRKWYEEKQKRKEEELVRLGLDPSQSHRCGGIVTPLRGLDYRMTDVCYNHPQLHTDLNTSIPQI